MPKLSRRGAVINYEIWGDEGDWVTMVNGHTRPLNDFRMMGRYLNEQGFRVLVLDNRGAGLTQTSASFDFSDMLEDVTALWLEHQITRTHLLGISMGGFIAQTLALEHAEFLRKLVLVSTAPRYPAIQGDESPWSSELPLVEKKLSLYFTGEFAQRNETLVRSMAKQIAKSVAEGGFATRAQQQRQAINDFDKTDRLHEIRCETLVIHGDEDRVIPFSAAEELARGIPGARLEVFKNAGHLLLAERPKDLYAVVGEFLST